MFDSFAKYLLEKNAFLSLFEGYTNPATAIKEKSLTALSDAGVPLPEFLVPEEHKNLQDMLNELEAKKRELGLDKDTPDKEFMNPKRKSPVPPESTNFSGDIVREERGGKRRRDADFLSSPPTQTSPDMAREY